MAAYGLLGRRLGHSLSPQIHGLLGGYTYDLIEKEPEELPAFFSNCPYRGINVTVPYKKSVLTFCDELDETAVRAGCVNTVLFQNKKIVGYNTDAFGFLYLLSANRISPAGKAAAVLGSGGASGTVCSVLQQAGARKITVISRTGENHYGNLSKNTDTELLVNTTPVGMFPDNLSAPLSLRVFPQCEAAIDVIYNPLRTKLLLEAESVGISAVNGLEMLVAQAKAAAELFLGVPISDDQIADTVGAIRQSVQNVVLVGMPGCGKSTAARVLAKKLDREVLDTDTMVENAVGRDIPEIFRMDGEAVFRDLEHKAVLDATKQLGKVIATGGGTVLRAENRDAMRQNGIVVFLNRALSDLPTAGRPLSKDRNTLAKLYEQRLPLYRAVCDAEVFVSDDPTVTCERILEAIR